MPRFQASMPNIVMMTLTKQLKGKALNIIDRMLPVKPVERSLSEQLQMNRESRRMQLYFCRTCPSSIAIKRYCEKIGLRVVEKDVVRVSAYRNELVCGGGEPKVPCLKIEDDQGGRWLYSPDAIMAYLNQRF